MKLVCNFGINDKRELVGTKAYRLWVDLIHRSFDKKIHARMPSYSDCTVSSKFRRLSDFSEWAVNQTGFGRDGWELDKDILCKGNKEYHPDKCVFLPKKVNSFLRTRKKSRGDFPIGVSRSSDKFMATISNKDCKGGRKYLGVYETPIEAFNAYKVEKEKYIKLLANKYKDELDPRAYESLMSYQVEVTD